MNKYGFEELIRKYLTSFFNKHGFNLIEYRSHEIENMQIAIYQSPQCKICFYKSMRDGELNCLVGNAAADVQNLEDPNWIYLNTLINDQLGVPINELLENVPDAPQSEIDQISSIANELETKFGMIVRKAVDRD